MPFLGANRTALIAGWGSQDPFFTSNTQVSSSFEGGFAGYPYENYDNSQADLANGWTYDGTGASTSWGSFMAQTMYIPSSVFSGLEAYGSGADLGLYRIDFFDDSANFIGISPKLQCSGDPDNWAFNFNANGQGYTNGISAAALFSDRWITILTSVYDTAANYSNWDLPTSDYYFFRVCIYDTLTGQLLYQGDSTGASPSSDLDRLFKGYTSNLVPAGSRSAGQVGFSLRITGQFWPGAGSSPVTQVKLASPWMAMGTTLDPAQEFANFAGFATPQVSDSPWIYIGMDNSGDWVSSSGNYYIDNSTGSRITGGTAGGSYDWTFSSNNYTPALTYI